MSWFSISTGSAHLLYVTLKIHRHIIVNDTAYIGFVNTHSKGYGCNNNLQIATHESILNCTSSGASHSCMVRFNGCFQCTSTLSTGVSKFQFSSNIILFPKSIFILGVGNFDENDRKQGYLKVCSQILSHSFAFIAS